MNYYSSFPSKSSLSYFSGLVHPPRAPTLFLGLEPVFFLVLQCLSSVIMVYLKEHEAPPLSPILSHLYLGALSDVNEEVLQALGISHVMNVSRSCPQPPFLPEAHFHRVPINDSHSEDLLPFLGGALDFIDLVLSQHGRVLVHCLAGVSRSAAVAIAYTMRHLGMTLDEAYRYVKERRPSISPNFNFLGQLQQFQSMLSQDVIAPPQNLPVVHLSEPASTHQPWEPQTTGDLATGQKLLLSIPKARLLHRRQHHKSPSFLYCLEHKAEKIEQAVDPNNNVSDLELALDACTIAEDDTGSLEEKSTEDPTLSPPKQPLSKQDTTPLSLSLSRVFNWGERILLGVVMGSKVTGLTREQEGTKACNSESNSPPRECRAGESEPRPRPFVLSMPTSKHQIFAERHLSARSHRSNPDPQKK
uniref:protein-tyrosine-phosphatase n=2 Tax=Erpetoichthys calabaricus TaxID=27687 RepID=A0A8C4SCZ5_ERPCA